MGLDLNKLEKVVELAGGAVRARCPACAEGGQDRKGEHLRIAPDGKFGCCVFPGDREHRRRIFALGGERSRQGIKVRTAAVKVSGTVQGGILGRLGRVFVSPATVAQSSDASDGVTQVQPRCEEVRTPRTGDLKSNGGLHEPGELPLEESRTLRTPFQYSRVCVDQYRGPEGREDQVNKLKEFREGVRSVRMPHFTPGGTLVIPFDSPEKFHWWKGGQSIAETRAEVLRGFGEPEGKDTHGVGI